MKFSTEAKVGLMITLSFTIFITLVGVLSQFSVRRSGYQLRIYYSFLNDLRPGASLKIGGGITIGEVREIKQSGDKTEVVVWIDNRFRLPRTTTFAIFTTGVIGEKYINVVVPAIQTDDAYLKDGDIIYGINPASFDQMLQTFQSFLSDKDGGEILAEIFQNSSLFVENLNAIADENRYDINRTVITARNLVRDLEHQTRTLMVELNKLSTNVAEISETNKKDIEITIRNLSETTDNLNKIIYKIENSEGTLGKLISEDEIYNNLRDASILAKDFLQIVKDNPSKLLIQQ